MKKLLVATSALVAAGSAAALDVTLGGEIEAVVKYDGDNWSQAEPVPTLKLTIAGESMGWTYGGSFKVKAASGDDSDAATDANDGGPGSAEIYISSDSLGKVTMAHECGNFVDMDDNTLEASDVAAITGGCLEFTGAAAAGWALSAAVDVADFDSTVIGLKGSAAGASFNGEIVAGTNKYDAVISTAVGGATLGVELTGDLDKEDSDNDGTNEHDFNYEASIDFAAMGLDFGAAIQEDGELEVKTTIGNVTLKMNNHDDEEFLDNWSAEYKSTLAEGLTVKAKVASDDSLTITSTLEF